MEHSERKKETALRANGTFNARSERVSDGLFGTGDFFDALGDSLVTGPTRTNVNDIRIILIR